MLNSKLIASFLLAFAVVRRDQKGDFTVRLFYGNGTFDFILFRRLITALLCIVTLAAPYYASADIRITNVAPETTLRYPVALLIGQSSAPNNASLTLTNESSKRDSREFKTFVYGGRFKALAELVPGDNNLMLATEQEQTRFLLRYTPMTTPYIVRMVYVTDESGKTDYLTQKEDDPQDYQAKLSAAAKLMQTLTAESLNAAGLGRKTFRLEFDDRGEVVIHTLKAPHAASYYHAIKDTRSDDGDTRLYSEIYGLAESQLPTSQAKNIVIIGFSGYDPTTRVGFAHIARGGGGMGIFGNLNLFSWPSSLQDVQPIFYDPTPVDSSRVFDDSGFRGTLWGLAATTIGATLHEMGHTFGLPHSPHPYSIMSRGFDRFNRVFTLAEPTKDAKSPILFFKDDEVAFFERTSAQRLAYSRWFELDKRTYTSDPPPSATPDTTSDKIIITAPAGLRFLGIDRDGRSRDSSIFPTAPPKRLEITYQELARYAGGEGFSLALIDDNGQQTFVDAGKLVDSTLFVRSWKLSVAPLAWGDKNRFPDVTPEGLQAIIAELTARHVQTISTTQSNLQEHYRSLKPAGAQVAYALREIQSDKSRPVLLSTGSDDAIRVWLNGKLVVARHVFRGAAPDSEFTPATLQQGANTLVVEVANGGGDWGFYFRLLTPSRKPLLVTSAGAVTEP